jgi:hypothetical protein
MSNNKNLLKEGTIRRFMKLAGTDVLTGDFLAEGDGHGPGKWGKKNLNPGNHEGAVPPALKEQEEEDLEAAAEEGAELGAEAPMEEPMGAEMEVDAPEEEGLEGSVEEFARDVLDAIKDVAEEHGVDMQVEEMPEPEEIEVGEMEPEEEGEDLEAGGDLEGELGPEDEPEEELAESIYNRLMQRLMETGGPGDVVKKAADTDPLKRLTKKWSPAVTKCVKAGGSVSECEKKHAASEQQEENLELEGVEYLDEDALLETVFTRVRNRILKEKRADDMANVLAEKISRRLGRNRK